MNVSTNGPFIDSYIHTMNILLQMKTKMVNDNWSENRALDPFCPKQPLICDFLHDSDVSDEHSLQGPWKILKDL